MFTKKELAKFAIHAVVSTSVGRAVKQQIIERTDADQDDTIVKAGGLIAGEAVAMTTDPFADAAIERVATWWETRKNKQDTQTEQ